MINFKIGDLVKIHWPRLPAAIGIILKVGQVGTAKYCLVYQPNKSATFIRTISILEKL